MAVRTIISSLFSSWVEPPKKEEAPQALASPMDAFLDRLKGQPKELIEAVGRVFKGNIPQRFEQAEEADIVTFVESAAERLVEFEAFYSSLQKSFSKEIIDQAISEVPGFSLYRQGYAKLSDEEAVRIRSKCLEIQKTPKDIEPRLLHGLRFFSELQKDAKLLTTWKELTVKVADYWVCDPSLAVIHFTTHEETMSDPKKDIFRSHIQFQTNYSQMFNLLLKKKGLIHLRRSLKNEYAFLQLLSSFKPQEIEDRAQFLYPVEADYLRELQVQARNLGKDLHSLMQDKGQEILTNLEETKEELNELNSEITKNLKTFELIAPFIKFQLQELEARDLLEQVAPLQAINESDLKMKLDGFYKIKQGLLGLTKLIHSLSNTTLRNIDETLAAIRIDSPAIADWIEADWIKHVEAVHNAGAEDDEGLKPFQEDLIKALLARKEVALNLLDKSQEKLKVAIQITRRMLGMHILLRNPLGKELDAAIREEFKDDPAQLSYYEKEIFPKENPKKEVNFQVRPRLPNGNTFMAIQAHGDKMYILEGRKISYQTWKNALQDYKQKGPLDNVKTTLYYKWDVKKNKLSPSNRVLGDVMVYPYTPDLLQPRKKTLLDWDLYKTGNPGHIERLTTAVRLKRVLQTVMQGKIAELSRAEIHFLYHTLEKRIITNLDPLHPFQEVFYSRRGDLDSCCADGYHELQDVCIDFLNAIKL